jgi:ferrochelatase
LAELVRTGDDAPVPLDADAILIVSFGGPEGTDDVMPFLRNVTRGRGIPDERLATVAAQYELFGGVSPLNASNRALVAALEAVLRESGPALPVYWGNRNWDPYLAEAVAAMEADGVRRALAFTTSAFSSYSGCRQYREDIGRAREEVGAGAPEILKLRPYFDHPGFIEPMAANVAAALGTLPAALRTSARLVFTAHSIPTAMAATSDYEAQLRAASGLVADRVPGTSGWDLVFQSRSGPPSQPWLEPDIVAHLEALHRDVCDAVVVVPIGFTSDHNEVRFDLDVQARARADELGLPMARAATVGTDPTFVSMIRELVLEVVEPGHPRRRLSDLPDPGWCGPTCCPPPAPRPAAPAPG